jgi:hypothetical protein
MNPVFYAALQQSDARVVAGEAPLATPIKTAAGTIPTSVNPPRIVDPASVPATPTLVAAKPAAAPTVVATAPAGPAPKPTEKPSMTSRIGSLFKPAEKPAHVASTEAPASPAEAPRKESIASRIKSKLGLRGAETTGTTEPAKPAAAPGAIRPTDGETKTVAAPAPSTPTANGSLMAGAQSIPQASSFDSRWAAFR